MVAGSGEQHRGFSLESGRYEIRIGVRTGEFSLRVGLLPSYTLALLRTECEMREVRGEWRGMGHHGSEPVHGWAVVVSKWTSSVAAMRSAVVPGLRRWLSLRSV